MATSSRNLLVPSWHTGVRSHVCCFHLMRQCRCAHPTLWLGGSDDTPFMVGSSDHMLTWGLMVQYPVSTKAQEQAKNRSSKGEQLSTEDGKALLHNPKGLLCASPLAARQSLQTASLFAADTSNTIGCAGSHGLSSEAACTAAWTCCRAFSFLAPPSKLAAFHVSG